MTTRTIPRRVCEPLHLRFGYHEGRPCRAIAAEQPCHGWHTVVWIGSERDNKFEVLHSSHIDRGAKTAEEAFAKIPSITTIEKRGGSTFYRFSEHSEMFFRLADVMAGIRAGVIS